MRPITYAYAGQLVVSFPLHLPGHCFTNSSFWRVFYMPSVYISDIQGDFLDTFNLMGREKVESESHNILSSCFSNISYVTYCLVVMVVILVHILFFCKSLIDDLYFTPSIVLSYISILYFCSLGGQCVTKMVLQLQAIFDLYKFSEVLLRVFNWTIWYILMWSWDLQSWSWEMVPSTPQGKKNFQGCGQMLNHMHLVAVCFLLFLLQIQLVPIIWLDIGSTKTSFLVTYLHTNMYLTQMDYIRWDKSIRHFKWCFVIYYYYYYFVFGDLDTWWTCMPMDLRQQIYVRVGNARGHN